VSKNFIYKYSIKEQIKEIKKNLIKECLDQRTNIDIKKGKDFPVYSKYTNYLYNIFYNLSCNVLNKFTLKDVDFKLCCYLTDKTFNETSWHNHITTSSITAVIYLKTENKGIFFKHNNQQVHLIPEEGDLLIFPSFLDHCPEPSKEKPRITLNLELRCKENAIDIFNL